MKRPSRNILIGCGLLLFVGVCVVTILVVSGFGAFAIITPDPQGLTVDVAVEPKTVSQGDSFELVITAGNGGSRPLTISEITIPEKLLSGAVLTQASPAEGGRTNYGEETGFHYDQTIAPGEQLQLSFSFQALSPGDYRGDLDVVVGPRRKSVPLRVVVASPPDPGQIPEVGATPVEVTIPYQSVVQIITLYEENGDFYEGWTGSGSIISPDGLILTNAHVVLPDRFFPVDGLIVALTEAEDRPPVPTYYAEVVQADEALDIAVIRVTADLDGRDVDAASLNLPNVPLGDSNELRLADQMYIIGYPGIGGETITLTSGEVSGFTGESGRGERAFIKTSATIAGGNSGGLAANQRGELIGVPTQLGYGGDDQYIDCRVLADTNRDGFVDDDDNCVPTGGFINALRPLELALPLIEAAQRGEVGIEWQTVEEEEMHTPGGVLYEEDFSDPNSGWVIAENTDYSVGYQDGTYQMELQVPSNFVWSLAGENFSDVVITVDAEPDRPTGQGDYGVICRFQDDNNFYALEVSEDGYFTIWKLDAGEFVYLVDWEFTENVPVDGSRVTISAICSGDTLALAVDGVLLAEVRDRSFAQGDIGLIAGTLDEIGLRMAFDDLLVQEP